MIKRIALFFVVLLLVFSETVYARPKVERHISSNDYSSLSEWKNLLNQCFDNSGYECSFSEVSINTMESSICVVSLSGENDEYSVNLSMFPEEHSLYFWCMIDDYEREKEACAVLISNIPWLCLVVLCKEKHPNDLDVEYEKVMDVVSDIWLGYDLDEQYIYKTPEGGGLMVYYMSPDNSTTGAIYMTVVLNKK